MNWVVRSIIASVLFVVSLGFFTSAFANDSESSRGASRAANIAARNEAVSGEASQTPTSSKGAKIVASFTVFLLAIFVGVEVINKVPPTLHTPLMSGSNAISGITVIGSLLAAGHVAGGFGGLLGMIAVILAMINVVGGFLVTHRMLLMFKKR